MANEVRNSILLQKLHKAVYVVESNVLQLLLDAGCAVEGGAERICKKSGTESPLQIAAAMGHADCANLLLTRGADPFLKAALRSELDSLASDAFTLAAAHGHRYVCSMRLSSGLLL